MMRLNASFSKKVPAEGEYSSQSYHCAVEVELADQLSSQEIQAKIHETFALVRDAVEAELHGNAPKAETVRPPLRVVRQPEASARGGAPARGGTEKATNRQIKYVLDLAKSQGIGLSDINARVQKTYRAESVYDLNRGQASQLVDELKAAA